MKAADISTCVQFDHCDVRSMWVKVVARNENCQAMYDMPWDRLTAELHVMCMWTSSLGGHVCTECLESTSMIVQVHCDLNTTYSTGYMVYIYMYSIVIVGLILDNCVDCLSLVPGSCKAGDSWSEPCAM